MATIKRQYNKYVEYVVGDWSYFVMEDIDESLVRNMIEVPENALPMLEKAAYFVVNRITKEVSKGF